MESRRTNGLHVRGFKMQGLLFSPSLFDNLTARSVSLMQQDSFVSITIIP